MKTYNYSKQTIDFSDIWAVVKTLRSDFLTCGPKVIEFEKAICNYTGAKYCVAVSNATAGLHIAMLAAGIGKGNEVITSPITFLASANCALYTGANIKFSDIEEDTANLDAGKLNITENTKAIIPVHFAGQSCDMEKFFNIAKRNNLFVIEDAAHAIGSFYKEYPVGSCRFSDMTVFSFHPVKNITTGEGGAVTTNNEELYKRLKLFRSHGMLKTTEMQNSWKYKMIELGYNYRMTELQAALGISQLKRLNKFKQRRRDIVSFYNENLKLNHLTEKDYSNACFHLYPVLLDNRDEVYFKAKEKGLNLQVHYIPIYKQDYYKQFKYNAEDYPNAESYYKKTISLPLYPQIKKNDLIEIIHRLRGVI